MRGHGSHVRPFATTKKIKMTEYSKKFKETIDWACKKSIEFYGSNSRESTPNPYFIGFGNPSSKILLIGQELAFDSENLETLKKESIENPFQWQRKINENFIAEEEDFDPELPYGDYISNTKGNDTWKIYERVNRLMGGKFKAKETGNFKFNFFFTDFNSIPSEYSKGLNKTTKIDRIKFFRDNSFFQDFKIIILAFGDYLGKDEIKEIFGKSIMGKNLNPNKKGQKLIVYSDKANEKTIIHTRQLSGSVSGKLLNQIVQEIEK